MSQKFTLQEVANKSTDTSGLIVIDKKVYDITEYMPKHPGGDDILAEVLGKDASEAFHEVGHSEEAVGMLKEMLVGELDISELTLKKTTSGKASVSTLSVLSAISILALSVGALFVQGHLRSPLSQASDD